MVHIARAQVRRHHVLFLSAIVSLMAIGAVGGATVYVACVPTSYSVTSSAPPALANWTDTGGATWTPGGSFPGTCAGDTASDTNLSPTTLVVNTTIPNALGGLNLGCNGCVIRIDAGGSLSLAGNGTIASGATLQLNGGTFTVANGGSLTMDPGSSLQINSGFLDVQSGGSLTLSSTGTASGGGLKVTGGTFTITNSASMTFGGTSGFSFTGGTVDLQLGGTLDFGPGGTGTTSGGVLSGAGTLSISGGSLSIGSATSPGTFLMSAGTLTGPGFLSVTNSMTWSGGTITGTGGSELAGTATGIWDGSNGPMTLDGRTFNVYGMAIYSATTNELTLANGALLGDFGTFNISDDGSILTSGSSSLLKISPNGFFVKSGGTGTSTINVQSENDNAVQVSSGTLNFAGNGMHSGFFGANPGTTLEFSAASTGIGGGGFIDVGGTLLFSSGSFTSISVGTNVDGLLDIEDASVIFSDVVNVNDFNFDGGNLQLFAELEMFGPGVWSGGSITGSATFHVACCGAALIIDAANSNATLATELWNEGTVTYTAQSPNSLFLQGGGGTISNNGLFDIQTDQPILNAVVIIGDQKLSPASVAAPRGRRHAARRGANAEGLIIAGTPSIDNMGTFQKSAGTGTTIIDPTFTNDGGTLDAKVGTMQFTFDVQQNSGTINLGGGSLAAPNFKLDGGMLTGAGSITGNLLNNAGNVSPGSSPGTINVTGNYTQGASGTLTIEIGGTSAGQYDLLAVSGAATLDGTLNVSLINSFVPANGDSWQPLTFASRTGDFAVKNLPTFAGTHGSFTASYTPTSLLLTAVVSPQSADVSIGLSAPSTVNAGTPISVDITVSNAGPDPASGTFQVQFNATTLGSAITGFGGSGWTCPLGNAFSRTCTTTATLGSGNSLPILNITFMPPANAGTANYTASVTSPTPDPNSTNNSASGSTTVVPQTDLQITKSGPGGVIAGQNITYTISVTNNGPSSANGVTVSDPPPANATFVSATSPCSGGFPCTIGSMFSGQTVTFTSTYSTSPNFAGNVTNTATVSGSETDPNNTNNSASATTNVGAQADLSITKSGPTTSNTGQNVTYIVTVTNIGPSPAASVVVSDPTPVGIAFQSNTGACTTAYPCNIGTLNAGQSATINSTYTIPGNYTGTSVSNTATASSATNDPNNTNNSATATTAVGPQTDLSITKSGPTTASPGQNIVYTIVVTNGGGTVATNVTVTDATPAGTTFVSNTGACNTPFPCNVGTLNPNQSATITSTFNVPLGYTGSQVTNTSGVSSDIGDANPSNNSASATTNIVPPSGSTPSADVKITKSGPAQVVSGDTINFTIDVLNNGPSDAANVIVSDPTPSGLTFISNSGACATPFPCSIGTVLSGNVQRIVARYSVTAATGSNVTNTASVTTSTPDPNGANNSSSSTVAVVAQSNTNCPGPAPSPIAPAPGATVTSPVTFSWNPVNNATGYVVTVIGTGAPVSVTTGGTSAVIPVGNGAYTWTVSASFAGTCPSLASAGVPFNVCTPPAAPVPSVVGEATSGQTYSVQWTSVDGASSYELQESADISFTNPTVFLLNGTTKSFTKVAANAVPVFYRVRGIACGKNGAFSPIISIVIVPLPKPGDQNINVNTPAGSKQPVTFPLLIPGLPSGPTSFIASVDKPWLAVTPTSGIVPPEGVVVTISADPSALTNGTWTGTVLIIYGTPASSSDRESTEVTLASTAIPVSISLVTPVSPAPLAAAAGALVIPSVGHLPGASSQWQSDIRIANVAPAQQQYQVTFNAGSGDPSVPVKQTNVTIDGGATMALDDIVRNWFGIGSLGDSANGTLLIQILDKAGKVITDNNIITKSTVVTSRTYNVASSGTLGQFVPAIPFSSFIGNSSAVLSLQQIAQSSAFHTNLGVAEAAGSPVNLNVNVFDALGKQILTLPLSLKPGEQKQMNSFLEQNGISSLSNGRVEVKVTGGDGRVTSYASVVDSKSTDPFLVSPVTLGNVGSNRYVLAGIADLSSSIANWRSDVRIFNGGAGAQTATLTFYPNGDSSKSSTKDVTIEAGEVKALDDILRQTFGLSNVGGTLHVTTSSNAPLVVTARTYDQTTQGTLGQFMTAVTPADAVGAGDRSLQILQAEESPRYRTNLGIAEVTGKPVTAEVTIVLPDSRVSPRLVIPLTAFGSIQIAPIHDLGIGNTYNARLSVRVIDGAGKITAYGSVIDQTTQAPTYIPAQ